MYLLDTNVVSEAIKPKPDTKVMNWLSEQNGLDVYLSSLTIGELYQSITRSPSPRRAKKLAQWLERELLPQFEDHVLALDQTVMKIWGIMTGEAFNEGKPLSYPDSLLAATALAYDLILVTRNTKDIPTGVKTLNPWNYSG